MSETMKAMKWDRRQMLMGAAAVSALALPGQSLARILPRAPNIILIFGDDLGYGDLGSYGNRMIRTPHLDRLASEGVRLTDFYASANVCTPSRAGLMTGRYPIRTGLAYDVIRPSDTHGLPPSEVTIAEALKPLYNSGFIGKWHLGHVEPFWPPTRQGFDQFFGLPYSHDMKPLSLFEQAHPSVELTSEDVDGPSLTQRFFDRAATFVDEHKSAPFFLTLSLTAPHVPIQPGADHAGHSPAGAYGDVVEEVDAGLGRLMEQLRRLGLDDDTMLVFTSDNGPWFEGSTGPLRDRKGGGAWDGGYRVPFLVRYPRRIPAGRVSGAIGMNIDLLPTFAAFANLPAPAGVELDGVSLVDVLTKGAPSPHPFVALFDNDEVYAIRTQQWKFVGRANYRQYDARIAERGYPLLFDMKNDPGETYNVGHRNPQVLRELQAYWNRTVEQFAPLKARNFKR